MNQISRSNPAPSETHYFAIPADLWRKKIGGNASIHPFGKDKARSERKVSGTSKKSAKQRAA